MSSALIVVLLRITWRSYEMLGLPLFRFAIAPYLAILLPLTMIVAIGWWIIAIRTTWKTRSSDQAVGIGIVVTNLAGAVLVLCIATWVGSYWLAIGGAIAMIVTIIGSLRIANSQTHSRPMHEVGLNFQMPE
jgi:hypothetical protein